MRSRFAFFTGNVRVLTVCRSLITGSQSLIWPFFSLYIIALGGDALEVGLIYGLGGLAGLLLYPIGGYIADKRGRVELIGFSTFLFAFSCLIFPIAWRWEVVAVAYFIHNLVLFYLPAMSAIMVDSIPSRQRGVGLATTMAIPGALGILLSYLGGYIIDIVYGGNLIPAMRLFFIVCFLVSLVVGIVRFKFLKETIKKNTLEFSLWNVKRLFRESYLSIIETLKWLPRTLRTVALIEVVIIFFTSVAGPFWVVYATSVIGISVYEWGILLLLAGAVRIVLAIPMGHLVDRFGPRKMIIITSPIAPLSTLLFPFANSFVALLGVFLMLAIFNTIGWPAYSTLMANYTPDKRRGRVMALLGRGVLVSWGSPPLGALILFIPATAGSLIGGYVYAVNSLYPWYILTTALVICIVLIIKFIEAPTIS